MTAKEILLKAKKNIEKTGWCRGTPEKSSWFSTGRGWGKSRVVGVCAIGAFCRGIDPPLSAWQIDVNEGKAAWALLTMACGKDPIGFNDEKKTTKRAVLAKFTKAIKLADA
jgi:hypothetical protein